MASGSHTRYCTKGETSFGNTNDCSVKFSLVAWKFAGDKGEVHGMIGEKFENGEEMKVDVDCMVRNPENNVAIVGGVVKESGGERHPVHKDDNGRRAYVKLIDNGQDGVMGDYISNLYFDDGIDLAHCKTPGMENNFDLKVENNVVDARVSVCSKHGDWDGCLEKMKAEQAVQ